MKTKKLLIGIMLFVSTLIFTFLLGVFHQVGFNIKLWTYDVRSVITILLGTIGFVGLFLMSASLLWNDKEKKEKDEL